MHTLKFFAVVPERLRCARCLPAAAAGSWRGRGHLRSPAWSAAGKRSLLGVNSNSFWCPKLWRRDRRKDCRCPCPGPSTGLRLRPSRYGFRGISGGGVVAEGEARPAEKPVEAPPDVDDVDAEEDAAPSPPLLS